MYFQYKFDSLTIKNKSNARNCYIFRKNFVANSIEIANLCKNQ